MTRGAVGNDPSYGLPPFPGLLSGRFLAQVLLPGCVNADYVAVGDEQGNHDLKASFEPGLLP